VLCSACSGRSSSIPEKRKISLIRAGHRCFIRLVNAVPELYDLISRAAPYEAPSYKYRFGDRRGITTADQVALMTLSYRKVVIRIRKSAGFEYPCRVGQPSQGLGEPHRNPTTPRHGGDPHSNPTDETAHSGTLVMRVKGTENSRLAALMRVSWAVEAFSR
jgi:hypothetical protein